MSENSPEQPQEAAEQPAQATETDWKAEARKWEQRAKENHQKLKEAEPIVSQWQALEEASKTELELEREARLASDQRAQATLQRVAAAEVKAALTGVVPDPAALLEDLNIARFVTDDGEVNAEAIQALRSKYAALAPAAQPRMAPNPAQGTSAQPPLGLAERIAQAEKAGDVKTALRLKAAQAVGTTTQ